jgi:hypothetical protein
VDEGGLAASLDCGLTCRSWPWRPGVALLWDTAQHGMTEATQGDVVLD